MKEFSAELGDAPRFDPKALAGQVTPGALRYLTHAIEPGALLASRAEISFSGQVRLKPDGPWMPFQATETICAGHSYRVIAHARRGPFRAKIEDSYRNGQARSRVRVLGVIPVRSQRGVDLARSARGRLVVESTWLPSAFLPSFGVEWSEEGGTDRFTAPIDGHDVHATVLLGQRGELAELHLDRWSDLTEEAGYGQVPFFARVEAERSFDGYTIPSEIKAGWLTGTEREFEFFHAVVTQARFLP